jgi:hypothetical protein
MVLDIIRTNFLLVLLGQNRENVSTEHLNIPILSLDDQYFGPSSFDQPITESKKRPIRIKGDKNLISNGNYWPVIKRGIIKGFDYTICYILVLSGARYAAEQPDGLMAFIPKPKKGSDRAIQVNIQGVPLNYSTNNYLAILNISQRPR